MIFWILCHVLHIASTCASLGGLLYSRVVLLPNLKYISENEREIYLNQMIRRFSYIKWIGIAVVALTGMIQWAYIFPEVQNKEKYLIAFAIKMTGAISLFTVTFLLSLPSEKVRGMKNNRGFWSALNIVSAIVILIGAVMMRWSH